MMRPGVENVAEAGTGDFLEAGDPGLGEQFVAGHRVIDVGGDTQGAGEGVGHQTAQIGGVVKDCVVEQTVDEVVIHHVAAGHDVGDDAAAAHHGGQLGQGEALLGQPAAYQGDTVVQLVVEGAEGGQVMVGVGKAFHH